MVLFLFKIFDKKLCDLNYVKCVYWKNFKKNVKKMNIKNDDKVKFLNYVGKVVIIFCIKLFCIKFVIMYIIVENKIIELLCYVINMKILLICVVY